MKQEEEKKKEPFTVQLGETAPDLSMKSVNIKSLKNTHLNSSSDKRRGRGSTLENHEIDKQIKRSRFISAHRMNMMILEFKCKIMEGRYQEWYRKTMLNTTKLTLSAACIFIGVRILYSLAMGNINVEALVWLIIFCGLLMTSHFNPSLAGVLQNPIIKSLLFSFWSAYITFRLFYYRFNGSRLDGHFMVFSYGEIDWLFMIVGILSEVPLKINILCLIAKSIYQFWLFARILPSFELWSFYLCSSKIVMLCCGYGITFLKRQSFITASRWRLETYLSKRSESIIQVQKEGNMQNIVKLTHDIGTPLTVLQLSLDELWARLKQREHQSVVEQCTPAIRAIFHSIALLGLKRDTLQFAANLQLGKRAEPDAQPTNVHDLVLQRLPSITRYMGQEDNKFIFKIAEDVSKYALLDQKWVWQMCMTLLLNADRHTQSGSIEFEVTIIPWKSKAKAPDSKPLTTALKFTCRDSGPGVPPEEIPYLLQQAEWKEKDGQVKNGLGLFVLKHKAELLGGYAGLQKSNSKGSEFFFITPYSPADALTDSPSNYRQSSGLKPSLYQNRQCSDEYFKCTVLESQWQDGEQGSKTIPEASDTNTRTVLASRKLSIPHFETAVIEQSKGSICNQDPIAGTTIAPVKPPLIHGDSMKSTSRIGGLLPSGRLASARTERYSARAISSMHKKDFPFDSVPNTNEEATPQKAESKRNVLQKYLKLGGIVEEKVLLQLSGDSSNVEDLLVETKSSTPKGVQTESASDYQTWSPWSSVNPSPQCSSPDRSPREVDPESQTTRFFQKKLFNSQPEQKFSPLNSARITPRELNQKRYYMPTRSIQNRTNAGNQVFGNPMIFPTEDFSLPQSPWSSAKPTPREQTKRIQTPRYPSHRRVIQASSFCNENSLNPSRSESKTLFLQPSSELKDSLESSSSYLMTHFSISPKYDQSSVLSETGGTLSLSNRYRILVVDDQITIRKLLQRALESVGLAVDTAKNGREGLSMLQSKNYTHLIMDLDMPVMSGPEMIKEYWDSRAETSEKMHVCILTATGAEYYQSLSQYTDVFMDKPVMMAELLDWLDSCPPDDEENINEVESIVFD